MDQQHKTGRHHPVHFPVHHDNNRSVIVFVTACADKRRHILARQDAAAAILEAWHSAQKWAVGRYVIMPDHIHFFCAPRNPHTPLKNWMKFWKSQASCRWPRPEEHPIWQLDFWDTQLRRGESYAQKWDYVWHNPVRAGLVSHPEDWPHAGELNVLPWHDD